MKNLFKTTLAAIMVAAFALPAIANARPYHHYYHHHHHYYHHHHHYR